MSRPFNADYFKNRLHTSWIGSEFVHLKEVGSTNSWLKSLPSERFVHGMVVSTDNQTGGRGQHDREWVSEQGKNLTFTVGFRPPGADRLPLLTLATAYAVMGELQNHTDEKIYLKWPNDIMAAGKKLGGILTECIFLGSRPDRVIVGTGLNIQQTKFADDLPDAVSLASLSARLPERELLLAGCLSRIEQAYMQWHKRDSELHKNVSRNLEAYGAWVQLSVNGEVKEGQYKFLGINENGELLVLNEDLDVNTFSHEQIRVITGSSRV
jgi:BirA family transcriptional regulator, biotin operon repressor / biotin---[acetyl-CoA-carboxylase] ligase